MTSVVRLPPVVWALLLGLALAASAAPASARVNPVYTPVAGSPFTTAGSAPYGVAISPNGEFVASADYVGGDVSMFVVDALTSDTLDPVTTGPFTTDTGPGAIAFSPNGRLLATANLGGGDVSVFQVDYGTSDVDPKLGTLTSAPGSPFTSGAEPRSIAFSPSGSLLATANLGDGTVSVFSVDASTGALTPIPGSPFAVGHSPYSVVFVPGGLLATSNSDDTVTVFSLDAGGGGLTPVPGSPFRTGNRPVSMAISPDGGLLATADEFSNAVSVFSVNSSNGSLTPVKGSPVSVGGRPIAVAFDPSGTRFAVTNYAGDSVSVFSVDAGSGRLTPLPGSPFPVGNRPHGVAMTSGGQLLASADTGDSTISFDTLYSPTVKITSPAAGGTYAVGQQVATTYTCIESDYGTGISRCYDHGGGSSGTGLLDTSTAGRHTYTATAISHDGLSSSSSITYTVVLRAPVNTVPPVLAGVARLGRWLRCSSGTWTGRPRLRFQWNRDGSPIAGATKPRYHVNEIDEGSDLACTVLATNRVGSARGVTRATAVPVPHILGCPAATGRLSDAQLGAVRIGLTRGQARRRYGGNSTRSSTYADWFCLTPRGVSVGYADPDLLGALPPGEQQQLQGRVVWALTSNPYYGFAGIRPGSDGTLATHMAHMATVHAGRVTWYFMADRGATIISGVRDGVVVAVGIADRRATALAPARRLLVASFS